MPIIKGMQKNKSRTKVARRTDGSVKKVCTKCQKCGTPRQGHFDKKSRQEKIKLMAEASFHSSALAVLFCFALVVVFCFNDLARVTSITHSSFIRIETHQISNCNIPDCCSVYSKTCTGIHREKLSKKLFISRVAAKSMRSLSHKTRTLRKKFVSFWTTPHACA